MDTITKSDLEILESRLLKRIEILLESKLETEISSFTFDWLPSRAIRKLMDISPATLQNLRITGKVGYSIQFSIN